MPVPKVFIDGSAGTTGLRIRDLLKGRDDIELIVLDEEHRRDPEARRKAIADADLVVLCLPDEAAIEAAEWAVEEGTKVLDPSTAHRVADGWVFGLPEMEKSVRQAVRESSLVANPGCYATGVILAVRPLVESGLLPADAPVVVHGLSGYSGGGNKMIARWEGGEPSLTGLPFETPYALETRHKHIPEMTKYTGLKHAPQFFPAVGPFYNGMRLEIPLHKAVLAQGASPATVWEVLDRRYAGERFIRVMPVEDALNYSDPAFDPRTCNETNRLDISVIPNTLGHMMLIVQLDNLGKGAAGAAVQNMNLMLGMAEDTCLTA